MSDRTSSAVTVSAPLADVLHVIADFAAYPEWAGGVTFAQVLREGANGRPEAVRLAVDAGLVKDAYTLGYTWREDAESALVRWEMTEPGTALSALTGSYALTARSPVATEVLYELEIALRVRLPGIVRRRGERQIVDTALKGLRARVEGT